MEALGSPSISRAPMGRGHVPENRKLVYTGNRHNDIHHRLLPEIHFTASGFFQNTFDRLYVFFFFFLSLFLLGPLFFLFFFFCESTHYEKQKKKKKKKNNIKITTIYMI